MKSQRFGEIIGAFPIGFHHWIIFICAAARQFPIN